MEPTRPFRRISLPAHEGVSPVSGVTMRAVFGETAMFNLVQLDAGAIVPEHSHPEEQLGIVIQGVQVLSVDGVEHELGPLEAYALAGGVPHGGRGGPEGCLVLDVFHPAREDYRHAEAPAVETD